MISKDTILKQPYKISNKTIVAIAEGLAEKFRNSDGEQNASGEKKK